MPIPFTPGYEKTFFMNRLVTYMIRCTSTELKRNKTYKEFLQEHDEEIRLGKLIRVVEVLKPYETPEKHRNYDTRWVQVNRKFDVWIRDEKSTNLFSINLNNVVLDDSIIEEIIEFYGLTESWIKNYKCIMNNIGKDSYRQKIERDFRDGILNIEEYTSLTLEEIQKLNKDDFMKYFGELYLEYKNIKCYTKKNLRIDPSTGRVVKNGNRRRENRVKKANLMKMPTYQEYIEGLKSGKYEDVAGLLEKENLNGNK